MTYVLGTPLIQITLRARVKAALSVHSEWAANNIHHLINARNLIQVLHSLRPLDHLE